MNFARLPGSTAQLRYPRKAELRLLPRGAALCYCFKAPQETRGRGIVEVRDDRHWKKRATGMEVRARTGKHTDVNALVLRPDALS